MSSKGEARFNCWKNLLKFNSAHKRRDNKTLKNNFSRVFLSAEKRIQVLLGVRNGITGLMFIICGCTYTWICVWRGRKVIKKN